MKVVQNRIVPTGNILVVDTGNGLLECLSLGDYGAQVNLNQHTKVVHQALLPLTEKWVWTISSQYGCSMGCRFCDVPKVGPGRNASIGEMWDEVEAIAELHPTLKLNQCSRINVHFARMGEPTWNPAVIKVARMLRFPNVHPVVSTMLPRHNRNLEPFLREWMVLKNGAYGGNAGLQLSINSTDDTEREQMFAGNAMSLRDAALLMERLPEPKGRKITLNFAVADYQIDAKRLSHLFDSRFFVVKLTPMHKTQRAEAAGIRTRGDYTEPYPYERAEAELREVGFDVLVFIASAEEDSSKITCGNAILAEYHQELKEAA